MAVCCCGSGSEFEQCCGAILSGAAKAESAEALMRARYAAFVTGEIDFLHQSLHPRALYALTARVSSFSLREPDISAGHTFVTLFSRIGWFLLL